MVFAVNAQWKLLYASQAAFQGKSGVAPLPWAGAGLTLDLLAKYFCYASCQGDYETHYHVIPARRH
jgi:hypothetical protein